MTQAPVTGPWVGAREPRGKDRRCAEAQPGVGGVEGGHAAVAIGRPRTEDARTRPGNHRIPAERTGRIEGTDRRYRLAGPTPGRSGRYVTCEKALFHQGLDVPGEGTGEGSSLGLDVAEQCSPLSPFGRLPGEGPGSRGELAVESDHQHRDPVPHRIGRICRDLALDGPDRMLEGRVVQLHHVGTFRSRPLQAPGQVDQHDVEPTRAQTEVQCLGVDDHLIPRFAGPDEDRVDPGHPTLTPEFDLER